MEICKINKLAVIFYAEEIKQTTQQQASNTF